MSTIAAPCLPQSAPGGASGLNLLPHRVRAARSRRHRCLIEGAAALFAGTLIAIGWGAVDAADGRTTARRESIERELARLAPSLDEFVRLERAGQTARAGTAETAARARPYFELRSLLAALSSEARSGVTVSRLQRSGDGIELRVHAADSAACAAWVERLARLSGAESAAMTDIRLIAAPIGSRAAPKVEALVRVGWSGTAHRSPLLRASSGDRARTAGSAR